MHCHTPTRCSCSFRAVLSESSRTEAVPPMHFASGSEPWEQGRPSHQNATRRRSMVRPASPAIATVSSASGQGSRSSKPWQHAVRKPPHRSQAFSPQSSLRLTQMLLIPAASLLRDGHPPLWLAGHRDQAKSQLRRDEATTQHTTETTQSFEGLRFSSRPTCARSAGWCSLERRPKPYPGEIKGCTLGVMHRSGASPTPDRGSQSRLNREVQISRRLLGSNYFVFVRSSQARNYGSLCRSICPVGIRCSSYGDDQSR